MAIQSAVRCVDVVAGPAQPAEVTAVRHEQPGSMDAIACIQALELGLALKPIDAVQKGGARARLLRRTGLVLACSGLAVLIGGLAGTLSTL